MKTNAQEHTIKIRVMLSGADTSANAAHLRQRLEDWLSRHDEDSVIGYDVELAGSMKQMTFDAEAVQMNLFNLDHRKLEERDAQDPAGPDDPEIAAQETAEALA